MSKAITQRTVMGVTEMSCLFHALVGLSLGWVFGSRAGAWMAFAGAGAGLIFGMLTGFFLGRIPQAVRIVRYSPIGRYRAFAVAMGVFSVLLTVCFWWAGVGIISN